MDRTAWHAPEPGTVGRVSLFLIAGGSTAIVSGMNRFPAALYGGAALLPGTSVLWWGSLAARIEALAGSFRFP
jgi:hypothetical protein